jgi:hypothetical protein
MVPAPTPPIRVIAIPAEWPKAAVLGKTQPGSPDAGSEKVHDRLK